MPVNRLTLGGTKAMAVKLFLSYSHADETLRNQLEAHLAALKHQGRIDMWHDRCVIAGDDLDDAISAEIEDAKIILLLISSDFIASDYCYGVETARALKRHQANEARVVPVVLRPCDWHELPFGRLLALPTDGKPITGWPNIDEAFLDIVQGIKKALTELGTTKADRPIRPTQTIPQVASSPMTHAGPRSSNLRITRSFSDRDRDDFLHEAFSYLVKFFENTLDELSERNPRIEGRVHRFGENRFTAVIYRDGSNASACTIYIGLDLDFVEGGNICFSDREQDDANSWNESLLVDHDEQALFLKPLGIMGLGNQEFKKLSMQGSAELFWSAFIRPLQTA